MWHWAKLAAILCAEWQPACKSLIGKHIWRGWYFLQEHYFLLKRLIMMRNSFLPFCPLLCFTPFLIPLSAIIMQIMCNYCRWFALFVALLNDSLTLRSSFPVWMKSSTELILCKLLLRVTDPKALICSPQFSPLCRQNEIPALWRGFRTCEKQAPEP